MRTIASRYETDVVTGKEVRVHYYADLSFEGAVVKCHINTKHPLSRDEVDKFRENQSTFSGTLRLTWD